MAPLPPFTIDTENFLRDHCTLPALPQAVTQIQSIIHTDNVSISRVAGLIATDPSLVAQVLKVVNSAYYSLPREISDVNLAVGFLGIHETYRIALSISVVNAIGGDSKASFEEIWTHSVYTALTARYLKQHYEPLMSQGDLWATAILHDIGKLVYLKFFPEHFKAVMDHRTKHGCLFHEAIEALNYVPSSELGVMLAKHWRLPEKVRAVCKQHTLKDLPQLKSDAPENTFPRLVAVANLMAVLASNGLSQSKKESIKESICHTLNINEAEFLVHMGAVYELKEEVGKMSLSS